MVKRLNVHLTNNCDFNCDVCFERDVNESIKYLDKDKLLDFILTNNIFHVGFVGGECTLHPELSNILTVLKGNNIHTCVVTNGEHLDTLTILPNSLSIGIDNYNQEKVDKFLSTYPNCDIEITITPTDVSVIDSLIEKYYNYRLNISMLAFWNKNQNVKQYINQDYINKLKELRNRTDKLIRFWGDIDNINDFYNEENNKFFCIAPLNIYSGGDIQFCDLRRYSNNYNLYNNIKYEDIQKHTCNFEKCKDCNLKYIIS